MKLVGRYQVTILIFFESHSFFDDSQTVLEWIFVKISTSSVNRHEVANILSVVNIASNAFRFRFRLSGVIFVQTPTKNVSHVCQWDKHKVNCILEPPERNVSTELNLYLNFFHWNISFLAEHEQWTHIAYAIAYNGSGGKKCKRQKNAIDYRPFHKSTKRHEYGISFFGMWIFLSMSDEECELLSFSLFCTRKKRNRPHFVANRTSCMWPAEASE